MESFRQVDAAFPWFFPLFVLVLGACVGSFLNVVIYRMPAGRSVVRPGSTCGCGKAVAWYDNIPVLSWFLLRGKARCCGARFSIRYPAVETLTAVLFWTAWVQRDPWSAFAVMVAIGLFLCAAFIDLDTMEIPDVFSIGGFVVGVVLSALLPTLHGFGGGGPLVDGMRAFFESIQGAFIGTGLILWFALLAEVLLRKEAMGFGDVKLMGAIGAFFGWQGAVFALFGGAVIGTIVLIPVMLVQRVRGALEPRPVGSGADDAPAEFDPEEGWRVPFGPALVAGALVYALILQKPVDHYFADFAAILLEAGGR